MESMPRDIRSENLMKVLNVQVDIIWPFEKIIINKYLENKSNIKILDVGCGNGSFEEKLITLLEEKSISYEIIGIDLDKDSIELAKKINDLYNKGWIEYFNNVGNKLGFGANIPKILKNLNINSFRIEYIVIDNINSDNEKIIKFNKNMKKILLSVYQYSNLSKEEADNYYNKIINDITFENGFFMWTIPVISGNKYI